MASFAPVNGHFVPKNEQKDEKRLLHAVNENTRKTADRWVWCSWQFLPAGKDPGGLIFAHLQLRRKVYRSSTYMYSEDKNSKL